MTEDWDGIIEGWSTFGNVPVLLASQYTADGSTNYGHYQDEKVTDLLKKIEQSEKEEEQRIFIKELSLHIAEKSPALYVCARPQLTAVSTLLEAFVPHFRQFENIVNADLWIK